MKYLEPQILSSFKGYNSSQFSKDLISGLIVGVVALPLSLAFAIAAGVSPEKGLITAVIFGAIVAVLDISWLLCASALRPSIVHSG